MEAQKPKSIQTVGTLITAISALMIFSNLMGGIMFSLLGFGGDLSTQENPEITFIDIVFNNLGIFCLIVAFIGGIYLIGSLYLKKYRLWAKNLIIILSGVFIATNLTFIILGIKSYMADDDMLFLMILLIFIGLAFSIPLFFLVRFLNKNGIKEHFD